jgi:SAM-dependent methyltransferase
MTDAPLVSIVIPHFNQPEPLRACLESVLAQTLAVWEAVVVDDASAEPPVLPDDPRIRLVRHDANRGLAAARNTGIRAARCELILPLDSDDALAPDYLARTMPILRDRPEVDCVFTDLHTFGADDAVWHYAVRTPAEMADGQWIPGAGTLLRRALWERVGGYCEDDALRAGNEDWDFWIGALEGPLRPMHVPEPLYRYRRTAGSMSATLREREYATREHIFRRHPDFFTQTKRGPHFLAEGFRISALASLRAGRVAQARALFTQAWRLAPCKGRVLAMSVYDLCPSPVRRGLSAVSHLAGRIRARLEAQALARQYRTPEGRAAYWDARAADIDAQWGAATDDYPLLSDLLARLQPRSVLDAGCGSGRLFPLYLAHGLAVTGQDIAGEALALARARFPEAPLTLTDAPLERLAGTFDLGVANRVLMMIPPAEIGTAVDALCRLCAHVYLNELTDADAEPGTTGVYTFVHDYPALFAARGFRLADDGHLGRQHWMLFAREDVA